MNLAQEIMQNMQNVRNEGSCRTKDAYLQIASQMNQVLQSMQDQQSMFKRMANIAYEAGNSRLADDFQMMGRKMNIELETMEEFMRLARGIANS